MKKMYSIVLSIYQIFQNQENEESTATIAADEVFSFDLIINLTHALPTFASKKIPKLKYVFI